MINLPNNPSPFIPLPFIRGEGREFLKGALPLLNAFIKQYIIGSFKRDGFPLQ